MILSWTQKRALAQYQTHSAKYASCMQSAKWVYFPVLVKEYRRVTVDSSYRKTYLTKLNYDHFSIVPVSSYREIT